MKLNGKPGDDIYVKLTASVEQFGKSLETAERAVKKFRAAFTDDDGSGIDGTECSCPAPKPKPEPKVRRAIALKGVPRG